MRKTIVVAALVLVAAVAAWRIGGSRGRVDGGYRLVTVERGDLEAVVTSTGTLDAVTTVQVGTQVSGIIESILVDFNDRVAADQVVAMVDTTLLASAVREAQADLERGEADLRQAEREQRRIAALHAEGLVAETEFNTAQYDLDVARAAIKSARIGLERAQRNLDYATIRAPISGTVIERNVDVGQTVQASFSAPQLFLIAADLSQLQILAAVDESDIGRIAEGQTVRFTVQAYDDRTFDGVVRQVRLQSVTEENVVNYTVVVDVANPDGALLPGMTATVDFLVAAARDVLMVPNAALRFRPDEEMLAALQERRRNEGGGPSGDGARTSGASAGVAGGGSDGSGTTRARPTLLWYLDDGGELNAAPVRTGLSDGTNTEIQGRNLEAGMQVVAGLSSGGTTRSGSANPFQQNQQTGQRPPPPGGF